MSQPELILHHYDFSNYSEKVRLVLGLKDLTWRSVSIPAYAPKPDYVPLTAGYRRTPALQIGADVYCDTRLICEVLDTIAPTPPLHPAPQAANRALAEALVYWAESSLCRPLALYITGLHADRFADVFHADRARLHRKPPPSREQVKAAALRYLPQLAPQLNTIEALLDDGRPWALGAAPGIADFALYEGPWFLRLIGGESALIERLPALNAWMERVAAIGHGTARAMTAHAALGVARAAEPRPPVGTLVSPEGLQPGEMVRVMSLDNQDSPATGQLVMLDERRIVIASEDARCGGVQVHFPRLGYRCGRVQR